MFVRVFNKENNVYYKSVVYGVINNRPRQRYITFNPNIDSYELIEENFDVVQVINNSEDKWITCKKSEVLQLEEYLKKYKYEIQSIKGYEDVVKNYDFLHKILKDNVAKRKEYEIKVKEPYDKEEWTYIYTQKDADEFMKFFVGFHDSVIDNVVYKESYDERTLNMFFDNSEWCGKAELCFEGLIAMNLRPPQELYFRQLFEGCLIVKDQCIYWANAYLKEEDLTYEGSYVKALNLKWRKI